MSQFAVEPAELHVIARQSNGLASDLRRALGGSFAQALGNAAVAGAHAEFQATWNHNLEEIAAKLDGLSEQLNRAAGCYEGSEQGITGGFAATSVPSTNMSVGK